MADSLKNWTWEGKQNPGRSRVFSPTPKEATRKQCKHSSPPVSLSCREEGAITIYKYVVERWKRKRSGEVQSFRGRLDWRYNGNDAQQIKMRPKSLQKNPWVSFVLSNCSWEWGLPWRRLNIITWVYFYVFAFCCFNPEFDLLLYVIYPDSSLSIVKCFDHFQSLHWVNCSTWLSWPFILETLPPFVELCFFSCFLLL